MEVTSIVSFGSSVNHFYKSHETATYLAHALSVNDLVEQITKYCPPWYPNSISLQRVCYNFIQKIPS